MPNQYTNKTDEEKDVKLSAPATIKIEKPVEHKKPEPPKKQHSSGSGARLTHFPTSNTKQNYEKVKLTPPFSMAEDERDTFERRTKGQWTRKVTSITYLRDLEDDEYLDWNEERTGKTDMGRKITILVQHVGQQDIPTPIEKIQYDEEAEENKVVLEDRPSEIKKEYFVKFSKQALDELLEDCNPRTCEFIISQDGQRAYTVTKKELEENAGEDFDHLYNLKSDPNYKGRHQSNKEEETEDKK